MCILIYAYVFVEREIILLLLLFCLNWSELGWCMVLELQKVLKMMSISWNLTFSAKNKNDTTYHFSTTNSII